MPTRVQSRLLTRVIVRNRDWLRFFVPPSPLIFASSPWPRQRELSEAADLPYDGGAVHSLRWLRWNQPPPPVPLLPFNYPWMRQRELSEAADLPFDAGGLALHPGDLPQPVFQRAGRKIKLVPRWPEATDTRIRSFTELVHIILNSLLRSGAIQQSGQTDYVIRGGGFVAARPPGKTDDINSGVLPGVTWVDTAAQQIWFNVSNTPGLAVWTQGVAGPPGPTGPGASSGVSASRPTAGTAGRLYQTTDDVYLAIDNGATWSTYGPVLPLTPPVFTG